MLGFHISMWLQDHLSAIWNSWQSLLAHPDTPASKGASADRYSAEAKIVAAILAALAATTVGALASIGVTIGRWITRRFRTFLDLHIVEQKLELKPVKLEPGESDRVKIYCLLVRYGTDLYFEKLASDQERYEGRLQNRLLHNRVKSEEGWLQSLFHLPIHSRLGTQFKFFLEVEETTPRLSSILLKVQDRIEESEKREKYFKLRFSSSTSSEVLVTAGENAEQAAANASAPSAEKAWDEQSSAYKIACRLADEYGLPRQDVVRRYKRVKQRRSILCYRLWFTLADFPRVRTADGLENNMAFPI